MMDALILNVQGSGSSSSNKTSENIRIRVAENNESNRKQQLNRIKTTKYTLLTFLPINFYDQFRRAVYFYFLVVTIISFFVNSTMSPMVSLLPLLFVMIVTGFKEAYEDYQRYKNDNLINYSKVTILENGQEKRIESRFVKPGDLVVIHKDKDVPCDVVLVNSSDHGGKCYVTTANLDGESNLKTLMVPRGFPEKNLENLQAVIECESSKTDLYSFNGKIELIEESLILSLTTENLLLRGCKVKNTEKVIGCAVYCGMSTKLQLNSRYTGNKSASSEIYINKFLIFLVILMILACIILYMLGRYEEVNVVPWMDYLGPPVDVNKLSQIIEDFLAFLILFNYMVPISMYMNIELYRILTAFFIQHDQLLYDEQTDQRAVVNSSNLNEDLGQINILFSDKTGTLTKNEMNFKQCSIAGEKFHYREFYLEEEREENGKMAGKKFSAENYEKTHIEFFKAIALCHTVQLCDEPSEPNSSNDSQPTYQASSPDEKALLEACYQLGFVYMGDENDVLQLKMSSEMLYFKRLHILEFSSERKRMSVIVSDSEDRKWLFSKGAENVIFKLCSNESKELIAKTNDHITECAKQGLRTLAIAKRAISAEEYEDFLNHLSHAAVYLDKRKEIMEQCYKNIECDLELLGATAVEDALQENVSETLLALQKAGLKIWVLTGDKVETAVNIALACGHIPQGISKCFILNCEHKMDILSELKTVENKFAIENHGNLALIMDGKSLALALAEASQEFCQLALKCQAVLCCRLNPLQKSEVVTLIKRQKGYLTAAIGDGANDVSMIQEADVGIGIMGREGLQAARSSDFSIAKFFMLQRLLLIHGHCNTARLSFLVLFYSYKNILITGIMVLFQLYDLYSSTSVYHSLYMWLFDVVYISFSFTFLAITEKPYSDELLMSQPQLYQKNKQNRQVRWSVYLKWILYGALHSIVVFYFAYFFLMLNNVILLDGQTADYYIFGSILIQMVVVVGNTKLLLESKFRSYVFIAITVASFFGFMLTTVIYNFIDFPNNPGLFHAYNRVFCSLPVWLFTVVTAVACLIPDYTVRFVTKVLRKQKSSNLMENIVFS